MMNTTTVALAIAAVTTCGTGGCAGDRSPRDHADPDGGHDPDAVPRQDAAVGCEGRWSVIHSAPGFNLRHDDGLVVEAGVPDGSGYAMLGSLDELRSTPAARKRTTIWPPY